MWCSHRCRKWATKQFKDTVAHQRLTGAVYLDPYVVVFFHVIDKMAPSLRQMQGMGGVFCFDFCGFFCVLVF